MDSNHLIIYYIIKRIFLFADEWLFYFVLYKLFMQRLYIILSFVMLYGALCIFTSYYNINIIEHEMITVDQKIFILENHIFWILDKLNITDLMITN